MNRISIVKAGLFTLLGFYHLETAPCRGAEVEFRCELPVEIETDSDLHFYYKCTVRNTTAMEVSVRLKTDTLEVENNQELRLKCYDIDNRVTLEPGKEHSWWQHALARHAGANRLSVVLINHPNTKTTVIPTSLRRSAHTSDKLYRDERLQANWAKFTPIEPNAEADSFGQFLELRFTDDPVVIAGRLYSGVTFVVPEGVERDLVWCIREPKFVSEYYILPVEGRMEGFTHFLPRKSQANNQVVGPRDTDVVYQNLTAGNLVPGKRYIIWFMTKFKNFDSVVFSLNFPPKGHSSFADVFKGFYLPLPRAEK